MIDNEIIKETDRLLSYTRDHQIDLILSRVLKERHRRVSEYLGDDYTIPVCFFCGNIKDETNKTN